MDARGITWAGEIYKKFEAMCLQADEEFYEDTINYVENRVQKFGQSAKTFYTEVIQDLLPSSCVGRVKVAAFSHTEINEKPKQTISANNGEINDKEPRVEKICDDLTAEDLTPGVCNNAWHLPPMPPIDLDGNTQLEECCEKSKRGDFSVAFDASHESSKKERNDSECSSPASNKGFSAEESLMQNSDATECNSSNTNHALPPPPIDENETVDDEPKVESVGDEAIASHEENFDMEVIEAESIERLRFEESCVLVERNELDYVSRESKKHKKPYKKKMYDVVSFELGSRRKEDVCISRHEDISGWELL